MTFTIEALFTCPTAGAPMQSHDRVKVIAGVGIEGDRYAAGVGAYSTLEPIKRRDITFIALSGIDTANDWQTGADRPCFAPGETRRNVVLSGISSGELNDLVGRAFSINGLRFRGLDLAVPCPRPGQLTGYSGFEEAFDGRAGLRALVLDSGELKVGDEGEVAVD